MEKIIQSFDISSRSASVTYFNNYNTMKIYLALFVTVFCAVLAHDNLETKNQMINEVEDDGNWKVLYRLITDCAKTSDISVCLKMKFVTFLDRIVSLRAPLQINDYISLARDPAYKEGPQGRSMKPLSEAQLEESLPRAMDERNSRLEEMIQEKLGNFLQSRNIKMSIPADVSEGEFLLRHIDGADGVGVAQLV